MNRGASIVRNGKLISNITELRNNNDNIEFCHCCFILSLIQAYIHIPFSPLWKGCFSYKRNTSSTFQIWPQKYDRCYICSRYYTLECFVENSIHWGFASVSRACIRGVRSLAFISKCSSCSQVEWEKWLE